MRQVARREGVGISFIRHGLAEGTIVIPANPNHLSLSPRGVGKGLSTKVNANVGTSSDHGSVASEVAKTRAAVSAGADAVMDLSTGGDITSVRKAILETCRVPVGTVPIYQAGIAAMEKRGAVVALTPDDLFSAIEQQAVEGVDFMTVHCGITLESVGRLKRQGRVTDVVSRGGAFLIAWMLHNQRENPLYEQYDRLLDLARKYDFTLSLGDGLRPGCLADATDRAQVQELIILGELVDRARAAGVQAMVEGPGHVPLDQVAANMQIQKSICRGAPFYVLGPLVTDIGAGHDHITAAIGGAIAAVAGADFLCYVTPAEHLSLPDLEEVREGVIASRIAGHAADIVKGVPGAWERDRKMAEARKKLDWEAQARLALDPRKVRRLHGRYRVKGDACSMCGDFCAMELVGKYLGAPAERC
jgi:phosphomethylpyrimidine synthase